jgi:hypothetical protein
MELTRTKRYEREMLHSPRNKIFGLLNEPAKAFTKSKIEPLGPLLLGTTGLPVAVGLPPDFAEQSRHEGVRGTTVPRTREKTETLVRALPARRFDAEED